ncbi:MAG: hypothetical protein NT069_05290 [Planctomycetota bacterium]|nr:hypothetical protein [Planctomycetota bacterium]
MTPLRFLTGLRHPLLIAALATFCSVGVIAQDGFAPSRTRRPIPAGPSLSETTALLESAVRNLYKVIEPANDEASPNELLAYADLRSLRLYVGALEVAGWSLEKVTVDYDRYSQSGLYRDRSRLTDRSALAAWERYQAAKETVRTLLQRVRSTAILCEHQISFCDPQVSHEWRNEVLPALRDCIAATDPIFAEEVAYQRYGVPGQSARVVPASGSNNASGDAVDVSRNPVYQPYDGQGRGQGRYVEVRAFSGPVRVKLVRFQSHERSFGVTDASVIRELTVDEVVEPGQPLFVPCNRGRMVDVSNLEVEWAPADRGGRRVMATIDLVENNDGDRN